MEFQIEFLRILAIDIPKNMPQKLEIKGYQISNN